MAFWKQKEKNQAVKILVIFRVLQGKGRNKQIEHLELEYSRIIQHGGFISFYTCQNT